MLFDEQDKHLQLLLCATTLLYDHLTERNCYNLLPTQTTSFSALHLSYLVL